MRPAAWCLLTLFLAGCGSGGPSPTLPSAPFPAPAATPTPDVTDTVLRSAALRGANGHSASGTAEIVRTGASFSLELRGNFRIDSGFNDVYLVRDPGGISAGDLNLGDLRATSGAQSYAMPNDGSAYSHVLLWCRPFRVPIALGDLR